MVKPIFILGSGRSGTSILTGALRSGAEISGYYEGHFLPMLLPVLQAVEQFYRSKQALLDDPRHMIAEVNPHEVRRDLYALFQTITERLNPSEVWLDKSPDAPMIYMAPILLEIWPQSRFIFAKRRGIENIISRLKKFPAVPFEQHCIFWQDCMKAWLQVKDQLAGYCIEVEQRDIALQPETVAQQLGSFLELTPAQTNRVAHIFATERPQSTGGTESPQALDIQAAGWSSEQVQLFRKHCSAISQQFGYSEDAAYYRSPVIPESVTPTR